MSKWIMKLSLTSYPVLKRAGEMLKNVIRIHLFSTNSGSVIHYFKKSILFSRYHIISHYLLIFIFENVWKYNSMINIGQRTRSIVSYYLYDAHQLHRSIRWLCRRRITSEEKGRNRGRKRRKGKGEKEKKWWIAFGISQSFSLNRYLKKQKWAATSFKCALFPFITDIGEYSTNKYRISELEILFQVVGIASGCENGSNSPDLAEDLEEAARKCFDKGRGFSDFRTDNFNGRVSVFL